MAPSAYRRRPAPSHELLGASGVHFHPPGGLRLPPTTRSTTMDVLTRMVDHHLWLVGEIVDRTARVDDATLDRPIELSVESIDCDPTLRSVTDRLVSQLEMWNTAVEGGTAMPPQGRHQQPGHARAAWRGRAELPPAGDDSGGGGPLRRDVRRRRLRPARDVHVRRHRRARADLRSSAPHDRHRSAHERRNRRPRLRRSDASCRRIGVRRVHDRAARRPSG